MALTINTEQTADGETTVFLGGRLDTITAPELEAGLSDTIPNTEQLVLDLTDLEYVSSAGLRVLLKTHKEMSRKGGLRLIHVSDEVKEILGITGFTNFLQIED